MFSRVPRTVGSAHGTTRYFIVLKYRYNVGRVAAARGTIRIPSEAARRRYVVGRKTTRRAFVFIGSNAFILKTDNFF